MPTVDRPQADVVLRAVRPSDSAEILRWRNDEVTRAMSLSGGMVAVSEHELWFSRLLADPDHVAFVGTVDGDAVGWVRFDRRPNGAFLASITVAPERRGCGLGKALLARGLTLLRARHAGAEVHAKIKQVNVGSRWIFVENGFLSRASDGDVECLVLNETT